MDIVQITEQKKKYLHLLLQADEQESMIDRYLERGDMYVLFEERCAVAECVVTVEGDATLEVKNIAVHPDFRRRGYGKKLLDFLFRHYAGRYRQMQVGTGESPLTVPFYEHCGFRYSHRVPDFFLEHYDHPIVEEGILLRDMVYFVREIPPAGAERTA